MFKFVKTSEEMEKEAKKKLLTTKEAAEFLGVCRQTVHNYYKNFDLPRNKIGGRWFYDEEKLLQWALNYDFVKVKSEVLDVRLSSETAFSGKGDVLYSGEMSGKHLICQLSELCGEYCVLGNCPIIVKTKQK